MLARVMSVYDYRNLPEPKEPAVYVGRPGPWGNRFKALNNAVATRREAVRRHRDELTADDVCRIKEQLASKLLICWCRSAPCHAYTLAAIANNEAW